jgi:hypothetical protein
MVSNLPEEPFEDFLHMSHPAFSIAEDYNRDACPYSESKPTQGRKAGRGAQLAYRSACLFAIPRMKAGGASFSDISAATGLTLGSVTGRYYRLKGVRHPSQIARDFALQERRKAARIAVKRARGAAAIKTAINKGEKLLSAVNSARASGASFALIATCLGISGQALHKKYRSLQSKRTAT